MTAHTQLLVYNSENRFVGFFYQFTCRVKRTKGLEDKNEFWDRLVAIFEYLNTILAHRWLTDMFPDVFQPISC